MGVPSGADARRILELTQQQLSDEEWQGWLSDAQAQITETDDRLVFLYGACYLIATTKAWSAVTRIGDRTFTPPDPDRIERLYLRRCQGVGVRPELLRPRKGIYKSNSKLDDTDSLNPGGI